mmetsp:Transcript_4898/g.13660  ORF Transcript_4898/g.13660 Transcript_4898/m.13660 type:complete len:211 (+) Transcript_4898:795-1427(+)
MLKRRQVLAVHPVDAIDRAHADGVLNLVLRVTPLLDAASPPKPHLHSKGVLGLEGTLEAPHTGAFVHKECPGLVWRASPGRQRGTCVTIIQQVLPPRHVERGACLGVLQSGVGLVQKDSHGVSLVVAADVGVASLLQEPVGLFYFIKVGVLGDVEKKVVVEESGLSGSCRGGDQSPSRWGDSSLPAGGACRAGRRPPSVVRQQRTACRES